MLKHPEPIERHIKECSICQEEMLTLKQVIEFTSSIEEISPPSELIDKIHEEIRNGDTSPSIQHDILHIARKYIIYGILIISGILWIGKITWFRDTSLSMPVDKLTELTLGRSNITVVNDYNGKPAVNTTKSKVNSKVSLSANKPKMRKDNQQMGQKLKKINIDEVRIKDEVLVLVEDDSKVYNACNTRDISYDNKGYINITVGTLPTPPLKLKARVAKVVVNGPLEKEKLKEEVRREPPYAHFELGEFIVRLIDYEELRYARLEDVVLIYEPSKYTESQELNEKKDDIKDIIQDVVGSHMAEEIKNNGDLKKELKEEINAILKKGEILQISFQLIIE
jgi:flagellar basal body-associated protein FliL